MSEIIREIASADAAGFLATLERLVVDAHSEVPFWDRGRWIFRGQADSRWSLIPKALRHAQNPALYINDFPRVRTRWTYGVRATNAEQLNAEAESVRVFLEVADEQGLALPEDSARLREVLEKACSHDYQTVRDLMGGKGWPPVELRSLFALAQHEGVATRLLDWTRNPLCAAYFAAHEAARWWQNLPGSVDREKHCICVWALAKRVLSEPSRDAQERLVRVEAPGAQVANLRAQSGLFTLLVYRWMTNPATAPTVESLEQWLQRNSGPDWSSEVPLLVKVTLPLRHVGSLLRELHVRRMTAANLFPGFHGVARALEDEQWWWVGEATLPGQREES